MNLHLALASAAALLSLAFALCTLERWLDRRKSHEGAWTVALALDPDRVTVLDLSGNRRIPVQVRAGLRRRFGDRVYFGEDADAD